MSEPTDDLDLDRWPAITRTVEPLPGGLAALRNRLSGDVEQWQVVSRTVEPLPGGLSGLRRRLRAPARARFAPVALAAAVAFVLVLYITTTSAPAQADRSAMKHLLAGHGQPHPGAAAMGLVDSPPPVAAADPRLIDPIVVFRWVEPVPAGTEP